MKIITLQNVTKYFTDRPGKALLALKDINLEVDADEFLICVGPSGSGKSTLLRIASGLEKTFQGKVVFEDTVNLSDFSFVFQQFALLPWFTVYQNVELPLLSKNLPPQERKGLVEEELKRMRLEKFASARPKELSGGMKQRVGLARAFVSKPKVIFMDEPFSELDSFTAAELRQELLQVWQEKKPTIVMVTHLISEAIELADKIVVLSAQPGKIEKTIDNSLPRPRDKRSPEFWHLEDEINKVIRP